MANLHLLDLSSLSRQTSTALATLVALALLACTSDTPSSQTGSGGAQHGSGGSTLPGSGGSSGQGSATVSSGGATSSGGLQGSGGTVAAKGGDSGKTGGAVGSGGSTSSGGTTSSGGSQNTGGVANSGGTTNAGGATNSGGTTATGGALGGAGGGGNASAEIYASPTGSATNAGTEASPFDLPHALTVLGTGTCKTLWLLPGTYKPTVRQFLANTGTADAPLKVWAKSTRPVIDFSALPRNDGTSRGLGITGGYYHLKALEVTKAGDNCIWISGHHNTVEDVIIHDCQDTGLQITVGSGDAGKPLFGSDNLIKNCDSYNNADSSGENADGFAAKLRIGPGNVFTGCRSWNNSDDGWDLFAANDVVTITNCWAFGNGYGSNGDGNGFKLGGASDGSADEGGAVHVVTGCAAVGNKVGAGYTRNNNSSMPKVTASFSANNKSGECKPAEMCQGLKTSTMSESEMASAKRAADGSLPASQ